MKARVTKTQQLELKEKSIFDLLNDFKSNRMNTQGGFRSLVSAESFKQKVLAKSGLGFGVALLTQGVFQKIINCKAEDRPHDFSTNFASSTVQNSEKTNALKEVEVEKIQDQLLEVDKVIVSAKNDDIYLKGYKLNTVTKGSMSDRYNAIYKKVYTNKRIIQMQDLKELNGINKGQNFYGVTSILSLSSFAWMLNSKSMSRNTQTRVSMLGFLGLSASIIGIGHYSFKFSSFLHHLHEKYFYATPIKELQDQQVMKTNKPRSVSFESSNWDLKKKLPTSVQNWLKLN